MADTINLDGFMTNINDGIPAVKDTVPTADEKNTLITRLSHAIIDLLALVPVEGANVLGAKDAYIAGLTNALEALWGADKTKTRALTVKDDVFAGGSKSSRQTRRRRNGGKRNQRR